MKTDCGFIRVAALILALGGMATLAGAQTPRTWVSGTGDDANPCDRTAPCKTLAGAISKTAPAGEIDALDPGGYGALTITKSITIDGGGSLCSVLVSGTNGIVVSAGPNDIVTLRNVSINGIGSGLNGIRFLSGLGLFLDNVTIDGMTQNGLDVARAATGYVVFRHGSINKCGGTGISMVTSAGNAIVTGDNLQIHNCLTGVSVTGGGVLSLKNSDLSLNGTGVQATTTGPAASADLLESIFTNCGTAILCGPGNTSSIRLNRCTITGNGVGVHINGGAVSSVGNNIITGNSSNGPTLTPIATK